MSGCPNDIPAIRVSTGNSSELDLITPSYGFIRYDTTHHNLEVYEDLSKVRNNDKYEFIPNYRFSKIFEDIGDLAGNFSFSSFGNRKLFKTNVLETTVVNDLAYNSNSFLLDNGLTNNYSFLLKNVLSDSKNSASYNCLFQCSHYES